MMDNKFKPTYGGPLLQNMLQQHTCAQHMQDHLDKLAALYPDCDVRIEQDEIFLLSKNENPDLQAIGERIHAAAERYIDAAAAGEERELQHWLDFAQKVEGGWREGVQGFLGMAGNQRVYDFYVCPPPRPHLVKTKKGPRRYRVQMVRRYYTGNFCSTALEGIPGRIHQTTKLPE